MVVGIVDDRGPLRAADVGPRDLIQGVVRQLLLLAVAGFGQHVAIIVIRIRIAAFCQEPIVVVVGIVHNDPVIVLYQPLEIKRQHILLDRVPGTHQESFLAHTRIHRYRTHWGEQMATIHDSGYKRLFSNTVFFRQLIETFVHEPWVKEIDFTQCETLDKSFISEHYKETESDIIYKVRLKGREAYLVILLEFQSTVDRFMALRMLNYLTNFCMDSVESQSGVSLLPPVFPLVLYNGDRRWTAPVTLAELIQEPQLLGKYVPQFEYFKLVEHEYGKDELLAIRNLVSTLFLTEAH